MTEITKWNDYYDECAKEMPHFTLIASDPLAPRLIARWVRAARRSGWDANRVQEAQALIHKIKVWRRENPEQCEYIEEEKKTP